MKRIIVTTILSLVMKVSFAYDFIIDGIYYTYDSKNQSAIVSIGDTKYTGNIIIPESITYNTKKMKVRSIGDKAFYGCDQLTSVKILSKNIYIGKYAFYNCTNLTSVYGNNYVERVGEYAFSDCKKLKLFEGIIVGGVGGHAFENCYSLTSISLKKSLRSSGTYEDYIIGTSAFAKSGLTSVVIDHGTIYSKAFSDCLNLKKVTICNTVNKINKWVFSGCNNLIFVDMKFGDSSLIFESSQYTEEGGQFTGCNLKYLILGRDIECEFRSNNYSFIGLCQFKDLECLTITNDIPNISLLDVNSKKIYIAKNTDDCVKVHAGFSNSVYINSTLYVPFGKKSLYTTNKPWMNFFNIQEMDIKNMMLDEQFLTSISNPKQDQILVEKNLKGVSLENVNIGDIIRVFTLGGRLIKEVIANGSKVEIPLYKGFYIVKIGSFTIKVWI